MGGIRISLEECELKIYLNVVSKFEVFEKNLDILKIPKKINFQDLEELSFLKLEELNFLELEELNFLELEKHNFLELENQNFLELE